MLNPLETTNGLKPQPMKLWEKLWRMDWFLFALAVLLSCISVAMVYSATFASESEAYRHAYRMQAVWMVIGIAVYFVVSMTHYRFWISYIIPSFIGIIILLALVLVIGKQEFGAKSWIRIGPVGFQPSELAKVIYILFLSWYLCQVEKKGLVLFITVLLITIVPTVLIFKQPALGSAAVFLPTAYAIMFVAGVRKRYLFATILSVVAVICYVYICLHPSDPNRPAHVPFMKPYMENRILTFLDPSRDPRGAGWTINQSLIAIGSGGLNGKGYLQGTTTDLGFIPTTIAYNDFIFPVICEQFGFLGGGALIVLEGLLLLWILKVAFGTTDTLGTYIAVGVVAMLFTHMFVNIGMTIKVVPITGIPLPFISYGGTFLVVCLACVGLVQSVWIHRRNQ